MKTKELRAKIRDILDNNGRLPFGSDPTNELVALFQSELRESLVGVQAAATKLALERAFGKELKKLDD